MHKKGLVKWEVLTFSNKWDDITEQDPFCYSWKEHAPGAIDFTHKRQHFKDQHCYFWPVSRNPFLKLIAALTINYKLKIKHVKSLWNPQTWIRMTPEGLHRVQSKNSLFLQIIFQCLWAAQIISMNILWNKIKVNRARRCTISWVYVQQTCHG